MLKFNQAGLIALISVLYGCASVPAEGGSAAANSASNSAQATASDGIQDAGAEDALNSELATTGAEKDVPVDTIIAIDLVAAVMQLPDYAPFYTTVQFSEPRTPFGRAIKKAMSQSGYGIQTVEQDQGVHYVSYASRLVTTESGETMEYSLKVKDLEVQRRYKSEDKTLFPLSEIIVTGVAPSKVIVNDEIYVSHAGGAEFPTGVTFQDEDGQVLDQKTTLTRPAKSFAAISGESIANEQYLVLARASIFTVDRIEGKASTQYKAKDYSPTKQLTIKFKSDSLALGNANKMGINKMLNSFEPISDIYTITGCSHGRSLMFDGTEQMALSRSQRVKEEFLSYGIKQDNLREEGCFQTEYGETLPPNGVIITHKRRTSARS